MLDVRAEYYDDSAEDMPGISKVPTHRNRPEIVALHLTPSEKAELKRAADRATMTVSAFVRALALAAVRRGEIIVTDASRAA